MEKEYLCTLHSSVECNARGYREAQCSLAKKARFASCPHRIEAVVLAAAEPEESPENVVQQAQTVNPSGNAENGTAV